MADLVGDSLQKLIYLRWMWEDDYVITADGRWRAARRDDGTDPLEADSAEELRDLIRADSKAWQAGR